MGAGNNKMAGIFLNKIKIRKGIRKCSSKGVTLCSLLIYMQLNQLFYLSLDWLVAVFLVVAPPTCAAVALNGPIYR
jgi:hypothetical protein